MTAKPGEKRIPNSKFRVNKGQKHIMKRKNNQTGFILDFRNGTEESWMEFKAHW